MRLFVTISAFRIYFQISLHLHNAFYIPAPLDFVGFVAVAWWGEREKTVSLLDFLNMLKYVVLLYKSLGKKVGEDQIEGMKQQLIRRS